MHSPWSFHLTFVFGYGVLFRVWTIFCGCVYKEDPAVKNGFSWHLEYPGFVWVMSAVHILAIALVTAHAVERIRRWDAFGLAADLAAVALLVGFQIVLMGMADVVPGPR